MIERPSRSTDGETESAADPLRDAAGPQRPVTRLGWTDTSGARTALVESRTIVGSAAGVDVQVHDPTVSRLHAELDPREDGVWVRDLGSRNGTFVNDVRVTGACVPPGGSLRLGGTAITVAYTGQARHVALWPTERFGPLIGRSAAMRELFLRLSRIAPKDGSVLIHGETGTGKELVAQAIHEASPRADGPFIVVDCAALPENLLEAELFGHAKGAFTGAAHARAGAFEVADGGTVFLDEIGEMPLAMQPKLLRVLEARTVRRLGEAHPRRVDVRFVSATHRDLRTMANQGAFREDLYFRLAVLPVEIPTLRARPEDIPALAAHLLPGDAAHLLTPELVREMSTRPWLGNVRELRNFVERVVALGARDALASVTATRTPATPMVEAEEGFPAIPTDEPFKDIRERWLGYLEREYLAVLLDRHDRNIPAVAQAAGLDRTYVYRLLKKHDL